MSMLSILEQQVKEKGWLALSTLYFDNSYSINVFNTNGYIAYSKEQACFFSYSCLDSTDTSIVENKLIAFEHQFVGQQQNITVVDETMLQHFDIAQYSHYRTYQDDQTEVPAPNIPTKAQIEGFTKNPDTGLYDGLDIVTRLDETKVSTYPIYSKDIKNIPYSGAIIDYWKKFYVNQDKFCAFLKTHYGVNDPI